eukprot:g3876.t1
MSEQPPSSQNHILPTEEKELLRVFKRLANFAAKAKLLNSLVPLNKRIQRIRDHKKRPDTIKVLDKEGKTMNGSAIDEEFQVLKKQKSDTEREIQLVDSRKPLIHADDLSCAMKELGSVPKRAEVKNMIWEVDENLDECVDWEEFKLMYERNVADKTGLEPFQLFNVVQFMMYDKDNSGSVSIDETMSMLYQRYGKERLESELQKLFGDDLKTADGDGELSFHEYLKVVNVRIIRGGNVHVGH